MSFLGRGSRQGPEVSFCLECIDSAVTSLVICVFLVWPAVGGAWSEMAALVPAGAYLCRPVTCPPRRLLCEKSDSWGSALQLGLFLQGEGFLTEPARCSCGPS